MATYPLVPDSVQRVDVNASVISQGGGAALSVRRARGGDGQLRKAWRLLHDHISLTEWSDLLAFFDDRAGQWESFDFLDPATNEIERVRFGEDTLRAEKPLGREHSPRFVVETTLISVIGEE